MEIKTLYDDDMHAVLSVLGDYEIKKASYIEVRNNQWFADLAPTNGPELGPFKTRGEALAAEHDWLKKNAM